MLRQESKGGNCPVPLDLVVAKILDVLNDDAYLIPGVFSDTVLNQVCDLADGVISRCYVEGSAYRIIGLNGTQVGADSVADVQDWPPNGGVAYTYNSLSHCRLEHGVDYQVKTHSRTITANSSLPK